MLFTPFQADRLCNQYTLSLQLFIRLAVTIANSWFVVAPWFALANVEPNPASHVFEASMAIQVAPSDEDTSAGHFGPRRKIIKPPEMVYCIHV